MDNKGFLSSTTDLASKFDSSSEGSFEVVRITFDRMISRTVTFMQREKEKYACSIHEEKDKQCRTLCVSILKKVMVTSGDEADFQVSEFE